MRKFDGENLLIYQTAGGVTVLGPGKRFVVWVQGCNKRCVGCIAPDSRNFDGGTLVPVEELATRILAKRPDGLTISGGEPMLQAEALVALIRKIRQSADLGVVLYTGYVYERLRARGTAAQKELLSLTDVLIDGEYEIELDDGLPHRGSSNQRILFLTPRYESEREGYYRLEGERKTQRMLLSEDDMFVVGVADTLPDESELKGVEALSSRRKKMS